MDALTFRKARKADMDWIYATFRATMKTYIEQTWGWDELFQQHGFNENLPPSSFTVCVLNGEHIGAYSVAEKPDHLWLEMLLILPEWQNRGLGSLIIDSLKTEAMLKRKALRLSVLKVNPAREFYERQGFGQTTEDRWSCKLQWAPATL